MQLKIKEAFGVITAVYTVNDSSPIQHQTVMLRSKIKMKLLASSWWCILCPRPTLVHTQPFLSLVLACLKGQEDQREALLSSIQRQLTQLLAAPAEVCTSLWYIFMLLVRFLRHWYKVFFLFLLRLAFCRKDVRSIQKVKKFSRRLYIWESVWLVCSLYWKFIDT